MVNVGRRVDDLVLDSLLQNIHHVQIDRVAQDLTHHHRRDEHGENGHDLLGIGLWKHVAVSHGGRGHDNEVDRVF